MTALSPELRDYLKPGLAGTIAAADARLNLRTARVWAARCVDEGNAIELYVLRGGSADLVNNVVESGRAALTLIEVFSYRSRAFKGACKLSQAPVDQAFVDECLVAQNHVFETVGLGKDAVKRMLGHFDAPHDMVGLHLEVDAVFDQSPKPGAGGAL